MSRILVLSLTFLFALPAFGWGEKGHRVTAEVAYRNLPEEQRSRVIAILRAHPRFDEDFVEEMPAGVASSSLSAQESWLLSQAAVWPDHIQGLDDSVRQQYHKGRWHYINLPVWLTGNDEQALEGRLEHNMGLEYSPPLRQNLNVIQALRGNLKVWRDTSSGDAEKAVALCWILHLVGDMHQPLHTVALFSARYFPTGDRGGNNIAVSWGDETRNLHAVWDGLPNDMDDLRPSDRTIRSMTEDVVDNAAIEEWLYHHSNLARKFVYTDAVKNEILDSVSTQFAPVISLDRNYLVAARSIARRQVNLAGSRIAALLLDY